MNINKNISVWRGDTTPPTEYHLWIKSDNTVYIFDGYEWKEVLDQITKERLELENVTNDAQVKRSEMGVANGVATLNDGGKIPSEQLPSYVDDVLEYDVKAQFPIPGETGKIYVARTTNTIYRWSGSTYIEISPAPDLVGISNMVNSRSWLFNKVINLGTFSGINAVSEAAARPEIAGNRNIAIMLFEVLNANEEPTSQGVIIQTREPGGNVVIQSMLYGRQNRKRIRGMNVNNDNDVWRWETSDAMKMALTNNNLTLQNYENEVLSTVDLSKYASDSRLNALLDSSGNVVYSKLPTVIKNAINSNGNINISKLPNIPVDKLPDIPLTKLPIVKLTQAEYDALTTKDENKIYIITTIESSWYEGD